MDAIREHQLAFRFDRESLPEHERDYHGGPGVALLDHPAVVGVLNEILSYQTLASETSYGFRYDHTGLKYRSVHARSPQLKTPGTVLRDSCCQGGWRAPARCGVGTPRRWWLL